ncbi:hypothetical protein [Piscinibacter defluvii]|uniref:hypothetical protein n=1 Tax=Piscinibacter defluvii TaxID=1796922 RepID=UPI00197C2D28|nr:hypothetical protein [Piscinibacter defluvii]
MPWFRILPFLLGAAMPAPAWAAGEQLVCAVTYGGQTQTLRAAPVASPYGVQATAIGSYFLFRPVFERPPGGAATLKIYIYADAEGGPVPLHVAEFAYPVKAQGRHGFTGLQRVYEPMRDGELEYWCALRRAGPAR